jgi:hypothetical protein
VTLRCRKGFALAAAALALNLVLAGPIRAQKTTLPPSLNTSNPKPAFIKNQLKVAGDLGRKTLAGLEALPVDDSVPIDEATLQNARDTYVLIRAARHGMELNKEQSRFPDPTMDLAYKRVDTAWNMARTPVDSASSAISRAQYKQVAIQSLSGALRLLDQAMIIMP